MDFPLEDEGLMTMFHTMSGQDGDIITTIGFLLANGDDYTQVSNDNMHDAYGDMIVTCCSAALTFTTLVTQVGIGGGVVREWVTVGSRVGSIAGDSLPPNVALLVNKNTGLAGRRERGRFYLPGVPESVSGGTGIVASGHITTVNTALATYFGRFAANPEAALSPAVLHRAIERPVRPAYELDAVVGTTLVNLTANNKLATQRERLRD